MKCSPMSQWSSHLCFSLLYVCYMCTLCCGEGDSPLCLGKKTTRAKAADCAVAVLIHCCYTPRVGVLNPGPATGWVWLAHGKWYKWLATPRKGGGLSRGSWIVLYMSRNPSRGEILRRFGIAKILSQAIERWGHCGVSPPIWVIGKDGPLNWLPN